MSDRRFTYENTTEDSECPFCGEFVPKGSSVCGKCQAVHGSRITAGGCLTSVVVGLILAYSLGAMIAVDHPILGFLAAAGVGLGLFYLFTLFIAKFYTKKGWFR